MIVTILGGSSASTPALINWLADQRPAAPLTMRLCGRTSDRLMAVTRASRILAEQSSIRVEAFEMDAWNEALQGSDVAIIQVRIGGLSGREFDETFPLEHGVPGDEGLGPGGLSAALRSWPTVRQMLCQVRQNAPLCLPILLTSPGSLLVRLAALAFSDFPVYALCELPFTTLAEICRATSKPLEQVQFSYAGVNHLGWLYDVTHNGENLIGTYGELTGQCCLGEIIQKFSAVPLKYFQLHLKSAMLAENKSQGGMTPSRAGQLAAIQREAMDVFRESNAGVIRTVLAKRTTPWYSEALGPLLLQLSTGCYSASFRRPYFLSTADAEGSVCERAYRLEGRRFHALPASAAPKPVRELNRVYMEYEKQAACAVEQPSPERVADALLAHPWVRNRDQARALSLALWRDLLAFEKESTCRH